PNGMMIAVEGQKDEPRDVVGADPEPMFAEKPEISLQNVTNATNDMPLWIFQIIPDGDGDGRPELSLVSRAMIATSGPHVGRVVPIENEFEFPGTFDPEVPVFTEENVKQLKGVAAVDRLIARMEKRKQNGESPTARVTF